MLKTNSHLEMNNSRDYPFDKPKSPIESEMWFDSETGEFSDFQLMPHRTGRKPCYAMEEDEEELEQESILLTKNNMDVLKQERSIPIQNSNLSSRKITYEQMKNAYRNSYDLKITNIIDKNLVNGISPGLSARAWIGLINSMSSLDSSQHYNRDYAISLHKFIRYVHDFISNNIYMVMIDKNWYQIRSYRFIRKDKIIKNNVDFGIRNEETIKEYHKKQYQSRKEYNKRYKTEHKEELKEYGKNYRENNKEETAIYMNEYYKKNKEKHKAYGIDYYKKNKDKLKKQSNIRYHKNSVKILEKDRLRRLKNKDKINKQEGGEDE